MKHSFVRYHVPPLLWGLMIFISSSIPSKELPQIELLGADKVIHFGIFFILCWLVYRSLRSNSRSGLPSTRILAFSVLLTVVYGASDEFHQMFVEGRQASVFDLAADALGALAVVLIHYVHRKKG